MSDIEIKEVEVQKLIKEYQEYADSKGFKLNPDERALKAIVTAILKKQKKEGANYCPCRVMTGDVEKDKEIICPCVFHEDEVKTKGNCLCRLFFKK